MQKLVSIDKKYKNNTNDFYQQFRNEDGDATYYIDSDGYFVKEKIEVEGQQI